MRRSDILEMTDRSRAQAFEAAPFVAEWGFERGMAKRDYYEVLGLGRDASEADVKEGLSPARDEIPSGPQPATRPPKRNSRKPLKRTRCCPIPTKKRAYDQFGHAGRRPERDGRPRRRRELLRHLQRRVRRHLRRRRHAVRSRAAPTCATRSSSISRRRCAATPSKSACRCSRRAKNVTVSGARKGTSPTTCSDCGGAGQIRVSQGFFSLQQTCPRCRGAGSVIKDPCRSLRRQRPRREAQNALGENSAGRRHRRSDPAQSAKAKRDTTAGRRAICTFRSRCASTRSSRATAKICIAKCRFRSPTRCSAANSKCRRWAAASS